MFGGVAGCRHEWGEEQVTKTSDNYNNGFNERWGNAAGQRKQEAIALGEIKQGQFCRLCNAWRGSYGLEPTIDLFVQHSVEVAREIRRVLRTDGVFWLNIGDSYATSKNGRSAADGKALGNDDRTFRDKPFSITELPAKNLCGIPWRVTLALQADGWILRSAPPWVKRNCLSGGTVVYARTQKGDMPMTVKDLVRLKPETVKLWNGEKWTQVTDFYQTPKPGANIEIEFRNGHRVGCTHEHRWPTERGLLEAKDLKVGDKVLTTNLPEPDQTITPSLLPDEETGWIVGMYLAEGCKLQNGGISFSGHTKEVLRYESLSRIATAYGGRANLFHLSENSARVNISSRVIEAIIDTYIAGDDAHNKHLMTTVWQRSNKFLNALLRGYLEGDGSFDARNNRWRVAFTNNDYLASDLRTIGARLGISVRLRRNTIAAFGKEWPIWKGEVKLESTLRCRDNGEIVAIRQSRARKFWDISVEDDPHLFALGSGILTHNSMPESVKDRPGNGHEYVFMFVKSARYWWDGEAVRRGNSPTSAGNRNEFRGGGAYTAGASFYNSVKVDNRTPGNDGIHSGRALRTSDFFFDSLDAYIAHLTAVRDSGGLLLEADGSPAAFVVNPKGYSVNSKNDKEIGRYEHSYDRIDKVSSDCPIHSHLLDSQRSDIPECDEQPNQNQSRTIGNGENRGQVSFFEPSASPQVFEVAPSFGFDQSSPRSISRSQTPESTGDYKNEVDPHEHISDAQTQSRTSRTSIDGDDQDCKTDCFPSECSQIAIDHNTQTHKMDRDPLTSFQDNVSVETVFHTGDKSESLLQTDSVDHTSENNTEGDFALDELHTGLLEQTSSRNEGSKILSSGNCTCKLKKVKTDHYATFPLALVEPMIKASAPDKCCPVCGAGWVRVVNKTLVPHPDAAKRFVIDERDFTADKNDQGSNRAKDGHKSGYYYEVETLGFRPGCACPSADPVPGIVLDPFAGSGTVGEACRALGRRFVGLDLSPKYLAENALVRAERKTSAAALATLPMFAIQSEQTKMELK